MDDQTRNRIEGIEARAKLKLRESIERDLNIVRAMYLSKSNDERSHLKDWIGGAADLAARSVELRPKAVLLVEFSEPDADGDDVAVTMSATAAMRAIECWDCGEQYTPSPIEFYGEDQLYRHGG
jgi:hypothetical protein